MTQSVLTIKEIEGINHRSMGLTRPAGSHGSRLADMQFIFLFLVFLLVPQVSHSLL